MVDGTDEPGAVPRRALLTPRSIPASTAALMSLMKSPGPGEAGAGIDPAGRTTGGRPCTVAGAVKEGTVGDSDPATTEEDGRERGAATSPLELGTVPTGDVGASAGGVGSWEDVAITRSPMN